MTGRKVRGDANFNRMVGQSSIFQYKIWNAYLQVIPVIKGVKHEAPISEDRFSTKTIRNLNFTSNFIPEVEI